MLTGAFCALICALVAGSLAVASPPPRKIGGVAHLNTYQPQLIPNAKR